MSPDHTVLFHPDEEGRLLVLPVTVRNKDGDEGTVLEGYAAVFDEWAQIGDGLGGFMESIAPGAFGASLKADDIRSFFNHNSDIVLGRVKAGTAEFREDTTGLKAVIKPPNTAAARDVVENVRLGNVTGMSFFFRMKREEWEEPKRKGDLPKRRLLDVQLFEAGPVTFPAYAQTSVSARDRAHTFREEDHAEADADRVRRLRFARARTT